MNEGSRPAVFLDRDGVLTKEKGYVCHVNEMEIFPYAAECVRQIRAKGYYAIVVTNQSGVARGLFTEEDLLEMNKCLQKETRVDAVYYCPHHPETGADRYRKACACRKPGIGLLLQANKEFHIDMSRSYMVGDRATDILAGRKAGIKTILLESGYGTARLEEEVTADYVVDDLRDVLELL